VVGGGCFGGVGAHFSEFLPSGGLGTRRAGSGRDVRVGPPVFGVRVRGYSPRVIAPEGRLCLQEC
jgi:hypothetical protein